VVEKQCGDCHSTDRNYLIKTEEWEYVFEG